MKKCITSLFCTLVYGVAYALAPVSYTPAAGATDVEYTSLTEVSVVFDDDIPTDFTKNGIIVYRGGDQTDKYQTTNSIQIDPANSKKLNIPVSIYTANEIFTVLIPQANIAGLSAGVTWSFTTAKQVITPANPKPANNATDVHPASVVSFDFTPSVLLSELDDTKISISDGANTVPVTVSVTGGFGLSTVTLGHANFEYAKTYTVTVDADALVSASSKKLSGSYSWSFSTPAVAPTAIAPASYLPANGATGVEADAEIAVVFDGPIPVSGTDWSGISITQGTTAITGISAAIDGSDPNKLVVSHNAFTKGGEVVTVTIPAWAIPGLVSDVSYTFTLSNLQFPLDNYVPADGATNVEIQQVIKVRVNHGSNAKLTGVDWSGVTVIAAGDATNYVDDVLITNPSIINRNQTIEIYTLSSGLPYNKLITVTIPKTAIPAQNGFELKNDIVWSFTTAAAPVAPVSYSPAAGATGVSILSQIVVEFDGPVTSSTSFAGIKWGVPSVLNGSISESANEADIANISVSGNTLTIPNKWGDMIKNSTYKVIIPAADIDGLAADIEWTFTTEKDAVTCGNFAPANNATDVAVDAAVSFRTNKQLSTILAGTVYQHDLSLITIKDDLNNSVVISGVTSTAIGASAAQHNIAHEAFKPATHYTVTIPKEAIETLAADVTWSFTTEDFKAKTLTPANGATDVDVSVEPDLLYVEFNDAVPTEGTDFTKIKIYIVEQDDYATRTIEIDPANPNRLKISASIYHYGKTVEITGLKEALGLTDDVVWSFTTAKQVITPANPKPANNATDVHPASVVSFDLTPNLAVMGESIDASKITISDGVNTVSGITVSVSGGFGLSTVTIGHANFDYGKTYTVTVDADAIVSNEKKLGTGYSWSFSTPAVAPTAIAPASYSPANGATGVEADAEIAVVFDGPIPVSGTDWSGISITQGTTAITGISAAIDGSDPNKLVVSHNAFTKGGEVVTVTIPAWAIPGLVSDVSYTFTLSNLQFPLDNYVPADGATNVEIQQVIKVRVNHGSNAKLTGVDWSGVTVIAAGDATNYVDDVLITNPSIINRNQTIEIYTLSSGLPYNKLITVTIPKTAIPAQNGFELKEDIVWSFTTEEDPTAIQAATVQPTVYPSVTTGKVTVKSAGKATVRVTSVLGKVLSVGIINGELTLDLSGYPAGTYLVSVGNSVYKVIKK